MAGSASVVKETQPGKHKTGYEVRCPRWDFFARTVLDEQYVSWHRSFFQAQNRAQQERSSHPRPDSVKLVNLSTGRELRIGTQPETEVEKSCAD